MDIMDSTDTPTGGLDGTTASSSYSSSALPLSVDQRDAFASPTNRSTYGGNEPTSSGSFGFSSGGSAFDRLDATPLVDTDAPNSMPTSTDDVMMPRIEFASHPSLTGGTAAAAADTTATTPTHATQQAKAKANSALESAKVKAADARDKAADMTDSAKVKAGELKDSAKTKAAHQADRVEDTADSIKDKLESGAERAKEEGKHLLQSVKSSLQSAERTVEDKYDQVKDDLSHRTTDTAQRPTAPVVKSTAAAEPTDTHPDASSMRDVHLHPGLASWPSHGNELPTRESNPHMTDAHHRALIAGEQAHADALARGHDDKDVTANPIQGWSLLQKVHDTIEDGAEAVKEKVDAVLERHVRTDATHHMSAAKVDDIPTLIDTSNTHNTSMVRAKMHPSAERTLSGHDQDD